MVFGKKTLEWPNPSLLLGSKDEQEPMSYLGGLEVTPSQR